MAKLKERTILALNKLVGSGCKPRAPPLGTRTVVSSPGVATREPQYSLPLLCRDHQEC
ncbi:hypothetical protein C7476_12346 [Phyllobacterium bourgognense]|uniref:Uncharacterized protein n=1 Tax=Phyllobacterium bourgognense TaxID=314236 RepID=A0A368YIC3_9HYPH|nr:hypothetical protein C7476_12346 [Phyllobacterium bourgognense]